MFNAINFTFALQRRPDNTTVVAADDRRSSSARASVNAGPTPTGGVIHASTTASSNYGVERGRLVRLGRPRPATRGVFAPEPEPDDRQLHRRHEQHVLVGRGQGHEPALPAAARASTNITDRRQRPPPAPTPTPVAPEYGDVLRRASGQGAHGLGRRQRPRDRHHHRLAAQQGDPDPRRRARPRPRGHPRLSGGGPTFAAITARSYPPRRGQRPVRRRQRPVREELDRRPHLAGPRHDRRRRGPRRRRLLTAPTPVPPASRFRL